MIKLLVFVYWQNSNSGFLLSIQWSSRFIVGYNWHQGFREGPTVEILIRVSIWLSWRYEFQKHGRVLVVLHEPALKTIHEALAFCGHARWYSLLDIFSVLQLVVSVLCTFVWVWSSLVQPLVHWRELSSLFWHPFWSLLCDFKMFGLMLTGQMDREIKRLGKRPVLQAFWYFCKIFSFVADRSVIEHNCLFPKSNFTL